MEGHPDLKICILGPGKRFLGGISYYTLRLANVLSRKHQICVVTFHQLVPNFLFPGAKRIGQNLSDLHFESRIKEYDGINWYWGLSILKALIFMRRERPVIFIFQWWTSSVAHTYLLLKFFNKILFKGKIIIVFHETLDPLENKIFFLRWYLQIIHQFLFKNLNAYVVHSNHDRQLIHTKFYLPLASIHVVPHGCYDHYVKDKRVEKDPNICYILFFGLLRPYKGVEYLIEAFNQIPEEEIHKFHLTVAGEVWEHYTLPAQLIRSSKYSERITFINRYIADSEVNELFLQTDLTVFPYIRASQSGAAHIAISYGLPVICTPVGGLKESMGEYQGTIFINPCDSQDLSQKLRRAYTLKGKKFPNPHPWEKTAAIYDRLFRHVLYNDILSTVKI